MKTPFIGLFACVLALSQVAGCGSNPQPKDEFYTSGSREADQRAEQRIAKAEQMQADGGKKDEKANEKAGAKSEKSDVFGKPADDKGGPGSLGEGARKTLFDRLGGQEGITKIIDDFVPRVLADPRVNWERKGVTRGGFSLKRNQSVEWQASDENVAKLKKHVGQFLALATGGPTTYEGAEMKNVHAGMHIANPEFDAAVGDLKATLDKLRVPTDEQKELLAIIESTRPQVVEQR
jgi:hemoglobin